jgi:hypothetical protein
LRQRTKSVETTDFSVKSTDKTFWRTVFGWLEHKPNFLVAQQILFFGAQRLRIIPTLYDLSSDQVLET